MNYELIVEIALISYILILFGMRLIMPQIVRQEMYFGVRLPPSLVGNPQLNELKRAYIRNYLLICGIYTLLFCAALTMIPSNAVLVSGFIIFFALSSWLYYLTHKRVLEFKARSEDDSPRKQVVVVDTGFRNDKVARILPSPAWFFLPLAIIILNIIMGYFAYDKLPIVVPSHWDAEGVVNGGVFKTYSLIFFFPTLQMFITILAFFLYRVIGASKQDLNALNPIESRERSRLFRYRWGADIIFLNVIIILVVTILNFFILQILPVNLTVLIFAQPLLIMFILLDILVMAVWIGQGGSRLTLESNAAANDNCGRLDDDRYWLGGLIYFNPRDPALFVEKRFGIAWGLNYGNFKAYILIAALIGSVFLINALMDLMLVY